MKISRNFIRKVYRLGIVDTRKYLYCWWERSTRDGWFPSIVRYKKNDLYGEKEELTIYRHIKRLTLKP